jgi:hypothetical protein
VRASVHANDAYPELGLNPRMVMQRFIGPGKRDEVKSVVRPIDEDDQLLITDYHYEVGQQADAFATALRTLDSFRNSYDF